MTDRADELPARAMKEYHQDCIPGGPARIRITPSGETFIGMVASELVNIGDAAPQEQTI
jgi:hypothetical protein